MSKHTQLVSVTDLELNAITGGIMSTGDGYCGTPYPSNPHAVTASASSLVSVPPVMIVSHY